MNPSQVFSTNILIIIFAILFFLIFLLLSFIFTKDKSEKLHMFFMNLAFICIPVFLIGLVDRVFLIKYFLSDTENLIKKELIMPFGEYVGNLEKYGMKAMHPPLDFNIIFNEMESSGTLLILDTVIPDIHKTFPSMRAALDRNVRVQLLVSHPESQITKFRADEIGPEWDYFKSFRPAIYGYISHFQAIVAENRELRLNLVEIRYYEDLPCMPMYILDNPGEDNDKLYYGFFLASASVEIPHVEIVHTRTGIYKAFEEYFYEKWERNKDNGINLSEFNGMGSLPEPRFPRVQ